MIDVQLEGIVWVAVVSMDHYVRAHFVQGKHDGTYLYFGHVIFGQRLSHEIANALEVSQAAPDVIPIAHLPISKPHLYFHECAASLPSRGCQTYLPPFL